MKGLPYIALRYFNAAGAHPLSLTGEMHFKETHLIPNVIFSAMGFINSLKVFGKNYSTEDGTCVRDYIHVWDLCEAHYRAYKKILRDRKSGVYNLGAGKGYSILEIIKITEKISGKKINYVFSKKRKGDPPVLVADYKKAKKELGWVPEADIYDIIKSAWIFYDKNKEKLKIC